MLNEAQQRAVKVPGHCLISACPGSGKTTVLKFRAARILQDSNTRIVGVTFTSEAARELKQRIRSQSPKAGGRLVCGTFHSLCKKQLERAGVKFKLASDTQQMDYMHQAFLEAGSSDGDMTYDSCVAFIEHVKSAVDFMLPSPDHEPRVLVYERYQQLLHRVGAFDFADLLRMAVRGMRIPPGRHGSVEPLNATHMLIDEFQDTDQVQFDWVKEHIKQDVQVTVVGDDDQSIYSWRNAQGLAGMQAFRRLTQASHITLDTTYRFPREIMEPAGQLIQCNGERIPKALVTHNRTKGSVHLVRCASRENEQQAIWSAILESGKPGTWAVLARTNALMESLEASNPSKDLTIIRVGGRSFWDMKTPAMFLSLVRGVALDEMHSLDIILRRAGMGSESLDDLHRQYQSKRPGAVDRFVKDKKQGSVTQPHERLRQWMKQWRPMLAKGQVNLVLQGMAHYCKTYVNLASEKASLPVQQRERYRLDMSAASIVRLKGTLKERLFALMHERKKEAEHSVRLMTMHAAKGLEFKNIWIMGCEDGVVPSSKSPIDEERRLVYVAMTRAKQNLYTSYVTGEKTKPSPFLQEAGLYTLESTKETIAS